MATMTTDQVHVSVIVPAENRLRMRREALDLSQESVAASLGMTRQALRRLEAGENVTVSPAVVSALAIYYGAPESEIYQDVVAAIEAHRSAEVTLGTSQLADEIEFQVGEGR
jgi:transcriptional regulator with XRE-family HTH domain